MQSELSRAKTDLAKTDPAPYFLSYTVNDQDVIVIAGAYGGLLSDSVIETTDRRCGDACGNAGSG